MFSLVSFYTYTYMKKEHILALSIVGVLILVLIGWSYFMKNDDKLPTEQDSTYTFMCDAGKSIKASFNLAKDESVSLSLSDGRSLSLAHTIAASGARYANPDESIVFWNKGSMAFIEEQNKVTFANCTTDGKSESQVPLPAPTKPTPSIPSKPISGSKTKTYTNATYGFSITYPESIVPENQFKGFYILSPEWRVGATPEKRGTPVVAFPVKRIDTETSLKKTYPLFFSAEVRVGISKDTQNCYTTDGGYTNQKVTNVTINGIAFKRYSFGDAAMMKYLQGESYRTIHNGTCFVVEQIKVGSTYRDDQTVVSTPEETLTTYYNSAESMIKSFKFVK